MEIKSRNAATMLYDMCYTFSAYERDNTRMTRVGPAIELPGVTTLEYTTPEERVLFSKHRNANPFFHLMESIWIIAGREDVKFISYFLNNIKQYSDNGIKFNAAYGHRMRSHFGQDQLREVVKHLEQSFRSRQAVINLWDTDDLNKDTLDRACNMTLVFSIPEGKVNLTVFNRSNDMWFGTCGANVVQFTQILELVANAMGLPMGTYYQVSNNTHLYKELYPAAMEAIDHPSIVKDNRYATHGISVYKMNSGKFNVRGVDWIDMFTRDAQKFCDSPFAWNIYETPYFDEVVYPMCKAFQAYKEGEDWGEWINDVQAQDWRIAGLEWLQRK